MIDIKTLGIGAGLAGAAAMWGQIKNVFYRVKSLVIVDAHFSGELSIAIEYYMESNFKSSLFGNLSYNMMTYWVKPKKKYALVGKKIAGTLSTYWKGWVPIFATKTSKEEGRKGPSSEMGISQITTLRGVFNFDVLVKEAIELYNESSNGEGRNQRFRVVNCYGREVTRGVVDSDDVVEKAIEERGNIPLKSSKYLGWTYDQLGEERVLDPFNRLYYDEEVNNFLKEFDRWFKSREWFQSRGLPWRIGCSVDGPPGTGKSSFARGLAQQYDMPIFVFDLASMSNRELNNYWSRAVNQSPAIVLFEDLDRVFTGDKTVIKHEGGKSDLTLDALLNCISGVGINDGIVTIVTANFPERLDPALRRKGRLDISLTLNKMNESNRRLMLSRILQDDEGFVDSDEIEKLVAQSEGFSGAEIQRLATTYALDNFWGRNR